MEVVCHLADSEALFVDRMKRVLAEDRPTLPFADPIRYVAALAYHERDAPEEVAFIGLVRRQMARILRAQPAEAWDRVGIHSHDGERTLEQLIRKAIDHLEPRLVFLRAKRQALSAGTDDASVPYRSVTRPDAPDLNSSTAPESRPEAAAPSASSRGR